MQQIKFNKILKIMTKLLNHPTCVLHNSWVLKYETNGKSTQPFAARNLLNLFSFPCLFASIKKFTKLIKSLLKILVRSLGCSHDYRVMDAICVGGKKYIRDFIWQKAFVENVFLFTRSIKPQSELHERAFRCVHIEVFIELWIKRNANI